MTQVIRNLLAFGIATACGVAPALAQEKAEPKQADQAEQPGDDSESDAVAAHVPLQIPEGPTWSSDEIAKIGDMLKGTWKTTAPVGGRNGSAGSEIVMSIVPIRTADFPDAMYVETARPDSMYAPYRRAIFQLASEGGRVVLRSMEYSSPAGKEALAQLTGFWAAPQVLPLLTATNVRQADFSQTSELTITPFKSGVGYNGATDHPIPAASMGAVEMTSELSLQPDVLTTADRGLDREGKVVWGPEPGEKYTFTRYNSPVPAVERRDNGLLLLWYTKSEEAPLLDENYRFYAQYSAWLAGGAALDTTRARADQKPGGPFGFKLILHVTVPAIKGWKEAFRGVGLHSNVRMLVPPELAYKEKGVKRKGQQVVPPNAPLVFEVEIVGVEPAEKPVPQALPEGVKIRPSNGGQGEPPR